MTDNIIIICLFGQEIYYHCRNINYVGNFYESKLIKFQYLNNLRGNSNIEGVGNVE